MPTYEPVSRHTHADRYWQAYTSLHFAAADAAAPLVSTEVPRACLCLPVAFLRDGGSLTPIAIQGLQEGENLCLTPDGRWRFPYLPARYRGYPFALRKTTEDTHVLCIDSESGLLSADSGHAFFDEAGEPAQRLGEVLNFLRATAADREKTAGLCRQLEEAGLLEPWPVTYEYGGQQRRVEGLLRCSETALDACDGETLGALRDSGALKLAYGQIFSQSNLDTLRRLKAASAPASLDFEEEDIEELLGITDEVLEFNF